MSCDIKKNILLNDFLFDDIINRSTFLLVLL